MRRLLACLRRTYADAQSRRDSSAPTPTAASSRSRGDGTYSFDVNSPTTGTRHGAQPGGGVAWSSAFPVACVARNSARIAFAARSSAVRCSRGNFFQLGNHIRKNASGTSRGGFARGVTCGVTPKTNVARRIPNKEVGTTRRWIAGRRGNLVAHTGFEPVIFALRGRCPGPLDECATLIGWGSWARTRASRFRVWRPTARRIPKRIAILAWAYGERQPRAAS